MTGEQGDSAHGAFREHVTEVLRARQAGGEPVARADLEIEVTRAGGPPLLLDLREILLELRATPPESCEDVLQGWLDARLAGDDGPTGWEDAAPHLRTALRTAGQAADAERLGIPWVARGALPYLLETAVLALPTWSVPVTRERADGWGRPGELVLERARANTAERAGEAVHRHDEPAGTTWHVDAGDQHGAGRLVLPGFLASFVGKVKGRPIAVVPERGHLFVAGDASETAVAGLSGKARAAWQESARALSPAIYTAGDDGSPEPYRPAGSGRLSNEARLGHLLLGAREYAAQEAEVQREVGREAFVARLELALRQADGRPFAWTSYAEGTPCYLPPAEVVAVGPPGSRAGWTTLGNLEAAAGPAFRRVVLRGLTYVDARKPPSAGALEGSRIRLTPEPEP